MADIAKQRTITTSFRERIVELNKLSPSHHIIARLDELGSDLIREIIYLGNSAKEVPEDEQTLDQYILLFEWMDEAKNFMLLWRNVMIEIQKGIIISLDDKNLAKRLIPLKEKSLEQLKTALFSLHDFFDLKKSQSSDGEKELKAYKKLINPWPLYKNQFLKIKDQLSDINAQFEKILPFGEKVSDAKIGITNHVGMHKEGLQQVRNQLQDILDFLSSGEVRTERQLTEFFQNAQEDIIENNPSFNGEDYFDDKDTRRYRILIKAENGNIIYKESNIYKNALQWVEAEVSPKVYSIEQQLRTAKDSLHIALTNARNRVLTQSQTDDQWSGANYKDPFLQVAGKLDLSAKSIESESEAISAILKEDFSLKNIYKNDYSFLTPSLQESVSQFALKPSNLLESLQLQWDKISRSFNQYRQSVYHEEQLGLTDRVCRYLGENGPHPNSENYLQTFLTKGFVGESFMTGRELESRQIENTIDQWNIGYRGSIAITGWRHSGKSFFGDYIAKNFFAKNTIYIRPNETIKVYDRKIKATYDLGEVLQFIKNYTLNYRPLLWIDDLELWHDNDNSVFNNARQLCDFIDSNYNRSFTIVALGNGLYNHLVNLGHPLSEIFHSTINMDQMTLKDVKKAIMIRHGATHSELIDNNGRELDPSVLHKTINKIHQRYHGNIGDILMQWANRIKPLEFNNVTIEEKSIYALPEIVQGEMEVILAVVHMFKRINEYNIRKILGPSFNQSYQNIIRRLLSMQVLKRDPNNDLSINDLLVNQIGQRLDQKGLIQYNLKTSSLYNE